MKPLQGVWTSHKGIKNSVCLVSATLGSKHFAP